MTKHCHSKHGYVEFDEAIDRDTIVAKNVYCSEIALFITLKIVHLGFRTLKQS